MTTGYATVSVAEQFETDDQAKPVHRSITTDLGCSEVSVDAYHVHPTASISLAATPEQICIPIGPGPVHLDGTTLESFSVGHVPAGVECTIEATTEQPVVVISTRATDASDTADVIAASETEIATESSETEIVDESPDTEITTISLETCSFTEPATSSIETARLTAVLGCRGFKINARRLDPGEHVPYHTEGSQEELFVPVRGPATMRIDDRHYETPVGSVTRVGPSVPRSAINDGDEIATWIMIGAPPTGGPTEWDPGATILE